MTVGDKGWNRKAVAVKIAARDAVMQQYLSVPMSDFGVGGGDGNVCMRLCAHMCLCMFKLYQNNWF